MFDPKDSDSRRPNLFCGFEYLGFPLAAPKGAQEVQLPAGERPALLLVVGDVAGHSSSKKKGTFNFFSRDFCSLAQRLYPRLWTGLDLLVPLMIPK